MSEDLGPCRAALKATTNLVWIWTIIPFKNTKLARGFEPGAIIFTLYMESKLNKYQYDEPPKICDMEEALLLMSALGINYPEAEHVAIQARHEKKQQIGPPLDPDSEEYKQACRVEYERMVLEEERPRH